MKRKKNVKRVLVALLIFVLSFSVISMIVTVVFFHMAFPRADAPSDFSYSYTQMDGEGYPYQRISFSSGSHMLTGYYYAHHDPKALVVIAAGFGDSGASHLSEMMYFVDHGFGVLCYDATGVGESEGDSRVGLTQPTLDLRAALDYVSGDKTLSQMPILLYGHSAGGYAAATCTDDQRVKAAVIICAFDNPVRLMCESARSYVGFLADVEYPFLLLENHVLFGNVNQNASDCIESSSAHVAVFEGSDDERVPRSQRLSHSLHDSDGSDITVTVCDEAPRSGHSGLWLSADALSYREAHANDTDIDLSRSNSLDSDFMKTVLTFYQDAL